MLVTDATRNAVWQEMLDTARLVRYYDRMTSSRQRCHYGVRLVLLASASAGILALIEALPEQVRIYCVAAIGVLVVIDLLSDFANKAAVLSFIRSECNEAGDELDALWGELQSDSINDDEARRRLKDLKHRMTRATNRVEHHNIPTNERLNAKCEEVAFKIMANQYAQG